MKFAHEADFNLQPKSTLVVDLGCKYNHDHLWFSQITNYQIRHLAIMN